MSPRLPNITARDALSAFLHAGFDDVSQRGSHAKLQKGDITLVIPMHHGDIKRPLLKALIKQAGLTEDDFRKFI